MKIAIALFDRFTALDAIGPYEVLSRLPGAQRPFVGERAGPVQHRHRHLALSPTSRFPRTCRVRDLRRARAAPARAR